MSLPRTFVGFSSTDIRYWNLMLAWKENENIDFDFVNCQLQNEINSEDEAYIKSSDLFAREYIWLVNMHCLSVKIRDTSTSMFAGKQRWRLKKVVRL